MDLGLKGKVALVSGASGGIGQAICETLLAEGANVAALCRGTADRMSPLYARARTLGLADEAIFPMVADLTDSAALERCIPQLLDHWDRIDILVNNAGLTFERPFLATAQEEARRLAEVNLWGTMHLTQLVLKPMVRARRGAVVNVTSVVASRGGRGVSAYAMTKAAVESMTRALALEMAPRGIRCNAVAPGVIETDMSRRLRRRGADELTSRIPLRRVGRPDEVAKTVAWVASEVTGGYLTGQVLTVDGGLRL